jgi:thioredoxin-related protein
MRLFNIVFFVGNLIPALAMARQSKVSGGIEWTKGVSLQQVKERAAKENKFIFIDAFTTWCQPCKEMDKYVYTSDSVSNFFNNRFISVKVQMDKTKHDDKEVQQWYAEAKAMQKQYRILAYPTYIFLSPQGRIVHKETGFKGVKDFVAIAAHAMKPGLVYRDQFEEYDQLLAEYNAGKKNFDRILYMIKCAEELGQEKVRSVLVKDYKSYLESLPKEQFYTKENIVFIGTVSLKSDSKLFRLFYPDGKMADKAIGIKGYSYHIIDRVIQREIVVPFLGIKAGGMLMMGRGKDTSEANWAGLYNEIKEKYPEKYATRSLLTAKSTWYQQHNNIPALYKVILQKLDQYGFDTLSAESTTSYFFFNWYSWAVFQTIDDRQMLKDGAKWMSKLVKYNPEDQYYMDTYANILYKIGKKRKAIRLEKRAVNISRRKDDRRNTDVCLQTLKKMEADQPTW